MKLLDAYDWDFCQIQYNYMNVNYQAGKAGLLAAAAKDIPVVVMEPLLGGKLAANLPKKAEALFKEANPAATPAEWALKWLWNQPEVTVVLSGMNSAAQLEENIKIAEHAQPGVFGEKEDAVFETVEKAFRESYKVPCTGCNYCMPCPQNVNIPGCFTTYNLSYATSYFAGMTMYFQDVTKRSPRQCIKCGKCEKHCPQHIKIMDELENVQKRMEPFWLKPGLAIFRAVQSRAK
jgi:predicted aldo/keto reductase-like oxidoreductase